MKPTIGLVSQSGVVPVSSNFDSVGPITKTAYDLAILLDVLTGTPVSNSFTKHLTASWSDISVASLDPEEWRYPASIVKPVDGAESQIVSRIILWLHSFRVDLVELKTGPNARR